ncbi:hypothetical protein [Paenibacillus planticolens]|uniref:Phage tail protein n=1 Tax=Paenibacillus planticolens TaxID=2654976 RepID=A0ABX1ZMM7_9BACL|nr:hypothetical protein [Paenibacillus planticolens]NOV01345.1 hypothetical protein [Paenibacillus planticolens]
MSKEFGPLTLPKSGKVIFFREPTGGDRLEVLKKNPAGSDDYVTMSELADLYIAAKCVTKVDDKATIGDYKFTFQSWSNADVAYYKAVFSKMFALSNESLDKMDQVVDFLLNGSGSADSSTSTT